MTIEAMKARKKELGYTNELIAEKSGVPLSTVQKIFCGATKAPRMETIEAISAVLQEPDQHYLYYAEEKDRPFLLRETAAVYGAKRPGEYTVEDYYALPDEKRVELIDGVFYDMAAPSLLHQKILGELHLQFEACSAAQEGHCDVYLSPCDVQLDNDMRTMLQPDLYVVCRDYDATRRAFPGAPDLVVEILSPGSRAKDMRLKLKKYLGAGVREYWIVDPKKESILVYYFEDPEHIPELFPFDSEIPVHISGGHCSIDFRKINSRIRKFYG